MLIETGINSSKYGPLGFRLPPFVIIYYCLRFRPTAFNEFLSPPPIFLCLILREREGVGCTYIVVNIISYLYSRLRDVNGCAARTKEQLSV